MVLARRLCVATPRPLTQLAAQTTPDVADVCHLNAPVAEESIRCRTRGSQMRSNEHSFPPPPVPVGSASESGTAPARRGAVPTGWDEPFSAVNDRSDGWRTTGSSRSGTSSEPASEDHLEYAQHDQQADDEDDADDPGDDLEHARLRLRARVIIRATAASAVPAWWNTNRFGCNSTTASRRSARQVFVQRRAPRPRRGPMRHA
jgi:hypothetical protein